MDFYTADLYLILLLMTILANITKKIITDYSFN